MEYSASLVAQMVKNLPAMWKTQVQSLGQEDPLEKEMAPHSDILAWEIPWTEEPAGLPSMGLQKSQTWKENIRHNLATKQQQQFRELKKNSLLLGMKSPDSDEIR